MLYLFISVVFKVVVWTPYVRMVEHMSFIQNLYNTQEDFPQNQELDLNVTWVYTPVALELSNWKLTASLHTVNIVIVNIIRVDAVFL